MWSWNGFQLRQLWFGFWNLEIKRLKLRRFWNFESELRLNMGCGAGVARTSGLNARRGTKESGRLVVWKVSSILIPVKEVVNHDVQNEGMSWHFVPLRRVAMPAAESKGAPDAYTVMPKRSHHPSGLIHLVSVRTNWQPHPHILHETTPHTPLSQPSLGWSHPRPEPHPCRTFWRGRNWCISSPSHFMCLLLRLGLYRVWFSSLLHALGTSPNQTVPRSRRCMSVSQVQGPLHNAHAQIIIASRVDL